VELTQLALLLLALADKPILATGVDVLEAVGLRVKENHQASSDPF